ncbi:MAG: hypothetical protein AAGF24_01715 [Cyanobacteria bacterium P01_H01_bin.121]
MLTAATTLGWAAAALAQTPEFDDTVPGAGVLKNIQVNDTLYNITIYYNRTFNEVFEDPAVDLAFDNVRDASDALQAVKLALEDISQEQLTRNNGYYSGVDLLYLPWSFNSTSFQALFLTETAIRGSIASSPSSLRVRRNAKRAGRSFLDFQEVEAANNSTDGTATE